MGENMRDEASTFKKVFYVFLSIVFVMLFCGASYALWNFEFEGEFNVLEASSITMDFLESDEVINLDNAIPMPDELGKLGEAFDFMVRTETSASIGIGYNIVLEKLEPSEGYSFLRDDEVKIYLTDDNENVLLEPTFVSEISGNYVIYKKFNVHNSLMTEIKDKYKLRVWIDDGVTSDRINEESRLEYKFRLGVKTSIDSTSNSTYKVTYNANGGEGVMSDSTFTFNELEELSSNTFVRPYYNFLGWSLKPNGEVIYNDGEEVSNITDVYNGKVNLYAVWEKVKYTTSVVVQNGTLTGDSSLLVPHAENGVFNLSSSQGTDAIVSCTNNQVGAYDNYVLTVKNISDNTVCTVNFVPSSTVLYTDGTFIINEKGSDRESNIALHGEVVKEYEPFSATQSYVFNSSTRLWANEKDDIIDVYIGQKIKPTNTMDWFIYCHNMETGNFTNLDTSSVTNMSGMFRAAGKESLVFELVGLDDWDTSNVRSLHTMFYQTGNNAESWSIGDISNWDTSNVTTTNYMFYYTASLKPIIWNIGNIGKWDVSSVTNMYGMFQGAGNSAIEWNIGDLSNWDVSSVSTAVSMFTHGGGQSSEFDIGDLSKWDVSNVIDMGSMFYGTGRNATKWSLGDLSKWDVSNVTNMGSMFMNVGQKVSNFTIKGIDKWDVSNVTNMNAMFSYSGRYSSHFDIDLSKWDVSAVTNMNGMFNCAGMDASFWSIGNISNWDVSNVTNTNVMFYNAGFKSESFEIDLSSWDVSSLSNASYMFYYAGGQAKKFSIGDLSEWDVSSAVNMSGMFYSAGYSTDFCNIGDLSNWNVSSATNMSAMFYGLCSDSKEWSIGDLSEWDVSNVTDMHGMFAYTGQETNNYIIKGLEKWNTTNVTDMGMMFSHSGINSRKYNIDVSNFDTSSVTSMGTMFSCAGSSAIEWNIGDLSEWDVSNVKTMSQMFNSTGINAPNWSVGDLSSWNTSNVINMSSMFHSSGYYSNSWSIGNISSWDTSSLTDVEGMFVAAGYNADYALDLSGWNVSLVTSYANFNVSTGNKITPPVWVN